MDCLYIYIYIYTYTYIYKVYSKNFISKFMQPIHDINYSTSICPFESGKCGKEGKKLQKFEDLENEKTFFD